jgi:hypothetical protein
MSIEKPEVGDVFILKYGSVKYPIICVLDEESKTLRSVIMNCDDDSNMVKVRSNSKCLVHCIDQLGEKHLHYAGKFPWSKFEEFLIKWAKDG